MEIKEVIKKDEYVMVRNSLKKEQQSLFWRRFIKNRLTLTGSIIIVCSVLISFLAPLLTPYSPYEMNPAIRLQAPSAEHIFGTDNFGRDLFTRVIYGIKVSVMVGFTVALISSLLGTVIGLYSAYYRSLDHVLMRFCDGLMAFPAILLAIAIVASLGPSTMNVIVSLSVVFTPLVARIVRSSALSIKEQTYIEALKSMGARSWRIIWLHIAPNTLSPLIVQSTFIFAISIITEAMLSFLGAGVPAPSPSLGNILFDGKNVIGLAWWMTAFPGTAVVLIVFGLNLFGDGLRDLLDPKHTN